MRPGRSTRYSISGMKNECIENMCVRLSSREEVEVLQNRQSVIWSRLREAARRSSMVCSNSSSSLAVSSFEDVGKGVICLISSDLGAGIVVLIGEDSVG